LLLVCLTVSGLVLGGCGTAPKTRRNDVFVLKWAIDIAERSLQNEKDKRQPPQGFETWRAYWSNRVRVLKKIGDSDCYKILRYIETRRAELGLSSVIER
jgi:hypothetical protein